MMAETAEELKEKLDSSFILNEILQKINSNAEHIDVQTNSLVILSSAVFVFSAQNFLSAGPNQHLYALSLAFFSSLSSIAGLLALNPPAFMDKRGQKESDLYVRKIAEYKTKEEYFERLKKILKNEQNAIEEYALDIYNLSKYSYLPKRKLFNLAKNLLIIGFLTSIVLFIIQIRI